MLALDDSRWAQLRHARGTAADIPALLQDLENSTPADAQQASLYCNLEQALLQQGYIYPASYAAVPHIVEMIKRHPDGDHYAVLRLVTRIEVARVKGNGPPPEKELAAAYQAALDELPQALASMQKGPWHEPLARAAAAALAAARGHPELAEAILALAPDRVPDFMDTLADDE